MGDISSPLLVNPAPETFIEALQCSELIYILSKTVLTVYMNKILGAVLTPLLFNLAAGCVIRKVRQDLKLGVKQQHLIHYGNRICR
jgi:hypothetical protein